MSDDEDLDEVFDAADADFSDKEGDDVDAESGSSAESEDESSDDAGDDAPGDDAPGDDAAEAASVGGAPARPEAPRVDAFARAVQRPRAIHVVAPADRVTSDRLQQTEAALLLSHRASQIASTGRCFAPADLAAGISDPVRLAYIEMFSRRCPLILRREVGVAADGASVVEDWNSREMILPVLPSGDGSDPNYFTTL